MRTLTTLALLPLLAACSTTSASPPLTASLRDPEPADAPPSATEARRAESSGTGISVLDIHVARRSLDEDFWTPVDDQVAFGLQYAHQNDGDAVGFETGLAFSQETDSESFGGFEVELDASLLEVYFGLHRSFGTQSSRLRPYLGGGLSLAFVEVDGTVAGLGSADDNDASVGLYLQAGLAFQATETVRLGVGGRLLGGTDVSLFGAEGDVDYTQLGVFVGFAF